MAKFLSLLLVCFSVVGQTLSVINTGTTSNDGTGDSLRTAFTKANTNFYQLWAEVFTNIPVDIANAGGAGKLDTTNGTAVKLKITGVLADVKAYGATGDNSTDDAADIQEALDSGNPVFIPAGTYRVVSKISVPSNARIYGAGDASVIRAGSSSISAFEIAGKTNILIQGVSFLGASNNSAASSATGNAVYITNSSGVRISDAKIRYFNTGVYVTGNSRTVRIDGQSEFVGNARAALNTDTASDVVIYGARISGDRTGVGNGSRGMVGVWFQAGGWDNIADKCNIYYLSAEGVNIKSTRSWAFGCHIEDADNGVIFETDGGDVTSSENGSNGGAIGNTATNIAGVGIYAGNTIGVNNAVVHHVAIIGNVISGAEYGMSFAGLNSSATNERPYALTVKGNVINGTTVGGGMLINANDSVFEGNIIRGAYTDGIQLYRGTNVAIIGNVISGPRNNGIYAFTGGLNNSIRGNSIFGGSASAANTYDGLRIASQTNAMIAGNMVSGGDWRYLASDESSSVGTMWADNNLVGSAGTAVFNFAGSTSSRFNNYGGVINVNDANSRVGIGTASPRTTAGGQSARLHIVGRNLLFGGDTDTTETDDQSKVARISVPPRDTTAGVDVTMLQYDGGAANNVLTIGGGTSANYAMSRVVINTGSGVSTTAGTERVRVDGSGNVSIGTGADAGAKLEVAGSVLLSYTGALSIRDSGGTAQTVASYTDASGVVIGNGTTGIRVLGGSDGISLGQSSATSPVTIPRKASADATTNLVDSNQLRIGASYWNGSSGTDAFMRLATFGVSTNGPIYYLGISDNDGNLRLALTNNGNMYLGGNIELGHVSDTTLARSAAGVLSVEGNAVPSPASPTTGTVPVWTNSAWVALPITSGLTMPSVELVDHFIQRQDGGTKFEGNIWPGGGGSGGSVVYQALADPGGRPGIARLNTVTTTSAYAYLTSAADGLLLGYGATEFECAIRLSALSDATDTYRFQAGLFDGYGTASVTDGAFVLYSHGVNSGKFQFVTSSNSTQSTGDTGVTVAAATWYRIKVVVNAAGTSATATVMDGSGTSLGTATLTSNIPTGSGRQCGSGAQMVRSAGTTTRYADVDWHRLKLQPSP